MSVKRLETGFVGTGEVKGFEFRLYKRGTNALIYEVSSEGLVHYEVFLIKERGICLDFVNREYSDVDFKEVYPKGNDFGRWAWTDRHELDAVSRFKRIDEGNLD